MAATADRRRTQQGDRSLKPAEWRLLAVLGLPTFAYALATTIATTYLPVLASAFVGSTTVVGLLIGVEGIMALLLAVPAGAVSDRRTRLPFVLAGTPVLVVALAAMGFVTSLGLAIIAVVVFFAAYFVAYEPYRALYPDLLDDDVAGRGQSTQALWRGLGTIVAIAAGGVLLSVGDAVPFVAGAAVTAAAIVVFLVRAPRDRDRGEATTSTATTTASAATCAGCATSSASAATSGRSWWPTRCGSSPSGRSRPSSSCT